MQIIIFLTILLFSLGQSLRAQELRLASVLRSNMVVQQGKPFRVWGWGKPGARVDVEAGWGAKAECVVDAKGYWQLQLPVPMADKGTAPEHALRIRHEGKQKELHHILIGEVWLCSGQSNMEMTMQAVPPWHKGVLHAETEIAAANDEGLRLFKVKRETSPSVRNTVQGEWMACTPASVADFSGVAYYFGRMLRRQLGVPVGLVVAAYGGASCQAFVRREVLAADPMLKTRYLETDSLQPNEKQPHLRPTLIYNALIHPLLPFSVRGILWYQGESNAGEILHYPRLNAAMIRSWREEAGQGELPFYYVQMTPYNWGKTDPAISKYARFREAQASIVQLVPNTGMVVTMDVGEPDNIHPQDKRPVGERLAGLALHQTYGKQKIVHAGPTVKGWKIKGDKVSIRYDKAGVQGGLRTSDGAPPRHFLLAGADSVFYPATARIRGRRIELQCAEVKQPVAFRYAFTDAALTNLENANNWPAAPYRSDRWERETTRLPSN